MTIKYLSGLVGPQKGFTLIELLVVVAILGSLASVAIPNVAGFMNHGKEEARAMELYSVQVAVTAYMFENDGSVPSDTRDLDAYFLGGYQALSYGPYTIGEHGGVSRIEDND